jgi:hypothetical protein
LSVMYRASACGVDEDGSRTDGEMCPIYGGITVTGRRQLSETHHRVTFQEQISHDHITDGYR